MTHVAYPAFTFAAPTGGIGPFAWTEIGAFPPGLSLSPTGQIAGTPITAGTFSFTLTVTDSSDPHQAATESVTLLIEDSPLVITSAFPPSATQGVPYAGFAFTASGGSVPLTWRLVQGVLPSGLTLNSNGTLSGTPLGTGSATFTVSARDTAPAPQMASASFTLAVNSSAFALTALVADAAGTPANTVDPQLVDPWGVAFAPGSAVAVANKGTSTSTQYDGGGVPQPTGSPLVVQLPPGPAATPFQPTGMVANSTPDFVVGTGPTAGAAQLIYAGASGMIAAWSATLGSSAAAITYTDTAGAVYTGLALANNGSGNFLYATDFAGRKIDVFNSAFQKQATSATSFAFRDPFLPAGYAPFGIQAINNGSGGAAQLYITYAQPQGTGGTPVTGPGLGILDVFTANGGLVRRLVTGGLLNAPWGLALAPTDFGTLGAPLLVGNIGSGKIIAFDPVTGRYRGTLVDVNQNALSVPGVRGIAFGNDFENQGHSALFFAANPGNSIDGVYGRIDAAHLLEIVSIQFDVCGVPGCSPTTQVDITPSVSHELPIAEMQFFVNGALYRTVTQDPFEVAWTPQANAQVRVTVIDVAGDVATSCQRYAATTPCGG